jgi:pheromone shutdown-related protein TraB
MESIDRLESPEQPLHELSLGHTQITVLGTAHVSRTSADTVEQMLDTGIYDAVAIELCPSRYNALIDPDSLARMNLFQVLKEGKVPMVSASLALGAFQQRMADQFGIRPGEEMRRAIDMGKQHELPVLLIDREVGITLKRIYRNVPWWQRLTLFSGLLASVLSREEIPEEEIERLKEGDVLESAFTQFAEREKHLYLPLIAERDRYMAARILEEIQLTEHRHVLVVIGAGHLKGMVEQLLEQFKDQAQTPPSEIVNELDATPQGSPFWRIFPWLIVVAILSGFVIGFMRSPDLGWTLVRDWVVINGSLSALGALIAGGHVLTVLTAFVAAPITSLNPTIGAGMVAGGAELFLRKPTVGDFDRLRTDTTSLSGWWKNRVARLFLVFILSSLGSAIGTYVAGFRIFDQLLG